MKRITHPLAWFLLFASHIGPMADLVRAQCLDWKSTIPAPGHRIGHALAFDSARNLTILFGGGIFDGESTKYPRETYGWNGTNWSLLSATGPVARTGHAMAFDPIRGVAVLFGGVDVDGGGNLGDTWEWNGFSWELRSETGPSARSAHRMVFDSSRGTVLLYGGLTSSSQGDLWEWNGADWLLISSTGPRRHNHGLAWDLGRARLVLHGGQTTTGTTTTSWSDTWEWNGSAWEQLHSTLALGGSRAHIVFSPPARTTVLAGSYETCTPFNVCSLQKRTFAWDGVDWIIVSNDAPNWLADADVVFDSARSAVVYYGTRGNWGGYSEETWEWDGTAWAIRHGTPAARNRSVMVYDSLRNSAVLFGGITYANSASETLNDTWIWDGMTWAQAEGTMPSPRWDHAMVFDDVRGRIVLFGGKIWVGNQAQFKGDTWEWDGLQWTLVNEAGPAARSGHSMAFDRDRGVAVLFGGQTQSAYSNETWEWDGVEWSLRTTTGPSASGNSHMVYDSLQNVILLFKSNHPAGVWEWNGIQWTESSGGPWDLDGQVMVYDEAQFQTTVFGGYNSSIDFCTHEMYEYTTSKRSGTTWTTLDRSASLFRVWHTAAYDTQAQEIIVFGGNVTCGALAPSAILSLNCDGPCQPTEAPFAESCMPCGGAYAPKSRYLSLQPPYTTSLGIEVALRVVLAQMPGPETCPNVGDFSIHEGQELWVGPEYTLPGGTPTAMHRLQSEPFFSTWASSPDGTIRVSDCNIVPCAVYEVEAVSNVACDPSDSGAGSTPLVLATSAVWGDVIGSSFDELPNGVVDFVDISACVDRFRNSPIAPPGSWCDVGGNNPIQGGALNIDFSDISLVVDAFRGLSYPFSGPTAPDPCP